MECYSYIVNKIKYFTNPIWTCSKVLTRPDKVSDGFWKGHLLNFLLQLLSNDYIQNVVGLDSAGVHDKVATAWGPPTDSKIPEH